MSNIFLICLIIEVGILILLKISRVKSVVEEEFVLANATLIKILDVYYSLVLESKVSTVRVKYDLNPESKSNSRIPYTEEYNKLLKDSAKEVMNTLISKDCLNILLKYYSIESLVMTIILNFKR